MSHFSFKLPDIGEGVVEAEIVEWHVVSGDTVEQDDPLADVMTDKATVEITSPVSGKVVSLGCETGVTLAVGSELVLFETGNGMPSLPDNGEMPVPVQGEAQPQVPETEVKPGADTPVVREQGLLQDKEPISTRKHIDVDIAHRPLASPAVRRRAYECGINLAAVGGTGPAQRILHSDLDDYLERPNRQENVGASRRRSGTKEIRVKGLRRKIAERMSASKRAIPHYSYIEEVDVTDIENLRAQLNEQFASQRGKLTFLPFLMRAMAVTLPNCPECNATYDDELEIVTQHAAVHICIGTQTPQGLTVPVVHHVEGMDLWGCANEIKRMSSLARDGNLELDDLKGSTITITSLGALGGIATTPVINRPEVAIVGVNKIVERPVVFDGQVRIRKMMNLSSSFDHRVVDGFSAASWIQEIKRRLECPATLFIE